MPNSTYHPRGLLVHGFKVREHPLYAVWASMKSRCQNENEPAYADYGGRGIKVCDRWQSFRFFAEDMYPTYQPGLTIERKNNDLGYNKYNCIWATRLEQANNKRTYKTSKTKVGGVVHTKLGFAVSAMYDRVEYRLGRYKTLSEAEHIRSNFDTLIAQGRLDEAKALSRRNANLNGSTGVRGVSRMDSYFVARTTIKGERVYLGCFPTIELAREAVQRAKS